MSNKNLQISAVVQTYNEEKNIEACLEALQWVDEIIIVDMYSTDATLELARKYTDKIYLFEHAGYVEPGRNFALSKATKDWILVVDADERITERLRQDIINTVLTKTTPAQFIVEKNDIRLKTLAPKDTEFGVYAIPRNEYIFGRWVKYGFWGSAQQYQPRLFRQGKCVWPTTIHAQPQVDGPMALLEGPMLHFSHLTISSFVNMINKYSYHEAQHRFEEGRHYSWFNTILASLRQIPSIFLKGKAYKDGEHGFVLAILMCMYTFLYRVKLWELHYKAAHPNSLTDHEPLASPLKIDEIIGTDRATLTAIVHTYNEEKNLAACLEALRWVDEIIVIDMYSTDKTIEIAERYGAQVYLHENMGYADPARNFGLGKATKDWILVVDADEKVTEKLKQAVINRVLSKTANNAEYGAYSVGLHDYMFGRWVKYGNSTAEIFPRVLKRGKAHWPIEVHGKVQFEGAHARLDGALLHFSHLTVADYVRKLNKYTSFEAEQQKAKGKRHGWFNTILAAVKRAFRMYYQYQCYKYGTHGFCAGPAKRFLLLRLSG